MKAKNWFINRV